MSPEERELLEKSVVLSEENNKILRSIKRSMLWANVMSILYWVIIIGTAIGAYYLIQPYIDQALDMYQTQKSNLDNLGDIFKNLKN